jgi:hypothetical protein
MGSLPAVGNGWAPPAPPPAAGWPLLATHIDLFAPLGAPGRPPAVPAAPLPRFLGPEQFAAMAASRGGDHEAETPSPGYPAALAVPGGAPAGGEAEADSNETFRLRAAPTDLDVDPDDDGEDGDADEGFDDDFDDDFEDGRDGEPWAAYSVARAGWRKRVLRVRVRSDGAVPELVLVARPGTTPPTSLAEGQPLARFGPSAQRVTRTVEVRLDGALLPWGVRLLPAGEGAAEMVIDHPPDDALVVR